MGLINCLECGTVCVDNPSRLCASCIRMEQDAEDKVAEFLRDTRKASLDDIHKATGVKHKIILRMLKSGRIVSEAAITYPCETCGAPISGGRVCDDCSNNIVGQLKPVEWQQEKRVTVSRRDERMYTKDLLQKNK